MILLKDATKADFEIGQYVKTNADARSACGTWRAGIVRDIRDDSIMIELEDNRMWQVGYSRCDARCEIEFLDEKGKAIKEKSTKVDLEKLEALVLNESAKQEIVALLKQHEHGTKLFEEWGLGETIEYGKGMTFLFHGGPGTGKTWGANCIAKSLGKKLSVISAAEIQSSEPGGANRAIQAAFRDAKKKVLLLDECDSLITSRSQVGMIIGSEINTLLTEIEKFEGVCILTTNRIETLDEALERRIALIVEFPNPNFEARVGIWERLLPAKMPLGKDVKVKTLAEFSLTGGQIKNVILQAARMAVANNESKVGLEYFDAAISRVSKSKGLLGKTGRYIQIGSDKVRG